MLIIKYYITPNGLGAISVHKISTSRYPLNLKRGNGAVGQHRHNNKTFICDLDLCGGYNLMSIFFLFFLANKRRHRDNRSNAIVCEDKRNPTKRIIFGNLVRRPVSLYPPLLLDVHYIITIKTTTTDCERLSTILIATHGDKKNIYSFIIQIRVVQRPFRYQADKLCV